VSTTTEIEFACDAPHCQKVDTAVIHSSEDREVPRCPVGWLTDVTYRYHACSSEHATKIGDWHLATHGKHLLWLTFKEAPLTGAPRSTSRPK
jgi:hypothetical protein